MSKPNGPRIYGMPDPKSQEPPPLGGLRGEGAPPPDKNTKQEFLHTVDANGRPILIQENSGTAFVEDTVDDTYLRPREGETKAAAKP